MLGAFRLAKRPEKSEERRMFSKPLGITVLVKVYECCSLTLTTMMALMMVMVVALMVVFMMGA